MDNPFCDLPAVYWRMVEAGLARTIIPFALLMPGEADMKYRWEWDWSDFQEVRHMLGYRASP